jgi:hypothetical protein
VCGNRGGENETDSHEWGVGCQHRSLVLLQDRRTEINRFLSFSKTIKEENNGPFMSKGTGLSSLQQNFQWFY